MISSANDLRRGGLGEPTIVSATMLGSPALDTDQWPSGFQLQLSSGSSEDSRRPLGLPDMVLAAGSPALGSSEDSNTLNMVLTEGSSEADVPFLHSPLESPRSSLPPTPRAVLNRKSTASLKSAATVSTSSLRYGMLEVEIHGVYPAEICRLFAGGKSDFGRSYLLEKLDGFLTHSWGGCWWQKSLALLYYSYFPIAVIGGFMVAFAAALYTAFLSSPVVCVPDNAMVNDEDPWCWGVWSVYVATPAMFSILGLCCCCSPRCCTRSFFLDKGSLDQTDPSILSKGLSSFGGFLRRSKILVVLWTPDYFERLWCVFELACFLHFGGLEDSKAVVLFPVLLAPVITAGILINLGAWAMLDTAITMGLQEWMIDQVGIWSGNLIVAILLAPPILGALLIISYKLVHLRVLLKDAMANFSVGHAKINREGDRDKIIFCIEQWYGGVEQFDDYVKDDLLPEVMKGMGTHCIPYSHVVVAGIPCLFRAMGMLAKGNFHATLLPIGYCMVITPIIVLSTQICIEQNVLPKRLAVLIDCIFAGLLLGTWGNIVFTFSFEASTLIIFIAWLLILIAYRPRLGRELQLLGFSCPRVPCCIRTPSEARPCPVIKVSQGQRD